MWRPLRWLLRPFQFEFFGWSSCILGSCHLCLAILRVKAHNLAFQVCSYDIRSVQEVHFSFDLCGGLWGGFSGHFNSNFSVGHSACSVPAAYTPPLYVSRRAFWPFKVLILISDGIAIIISGFQPVWRSLVTVFPGRISRCRHSIQFFSGLASFATSKCVHCRPCLSIGSTVPSSVGFGTPSASLHPCWLA